MNKVMKSTMMMMGAGAMMGAGYYMGLPKSKKKDLKNKAVKMLKADKELAEEMIEE